MDKIMIGSNRRKLLQTVDNSFNELYETKQNKVWYSDAEPSDIESEDGDLWISTASSITPPPIEYRDVDLSAYATNNIPNYMTITELPQNIEEYLSSGIRATRMESAFYNCRNLKKLDFNKYRIDTSKCQVMSYVFNDCSDLEELDLSSFDTSNVCTMNSMFDGCSSLPTLDLSSFDTSNVIDMRYMFRGCTSLTTLDLSSFDTSNVSTMNYMFRGCTSLTTLDLSSFNTSNVDSMEFMFYGCTSLTTLDLSSFNTSNVSTMNYMYMFTVCRKLTEIKGVIDFHNQSDSGYYRNMFTGCPISPSTPVQIKNPPSDENWWQTAGFASQDQFIIVS